MVGAARRWWSRLGSGGRRDLLIVVLLLFAYGYFQQRPVWNEYSRYDLVRAIVEQGTLRIDSFHHNTGDKAFFEGHWYSDKAPGTALLGIPVHALLLLTGWLTGADPPDQVEAVQALAFVESAIPTAILVLLLISFLRPVTGDRWAVVVGLAYGFGSIAFPFATMFFGHASSTAALFGSFILLHRLKAHPDKAGAFGAGFLAGWAALIEIPVILGVAALLVYGMHLGRGVAARFVAGGLPLAVVLGAYNWAAFGDPFSLGYQHTTAFAEQNAQGIVSIVWPTLDRAGELLFSERGLLRLAPWFALAPLGLVALRRRDLRFEVLLAVAVCAAFLTYNSGALNPFGGWTPGPRYLLPALPFAAVLVALMPARLRIVALPLMLAGVAVFFVATATMPNAPERYHDPLFELWLPRLASGQLAETIAWLRWGLPAPVSLALLLLGLGFGLLALAMSFGRPTMAARVELRAPIAIGLMALALAVPYPLPAPVRLTQPAASAAPELFVAELGHTRSVVDGDLEVVLWAKVDNRGGGLSSSLTTFSVWRASGEEIWAASYGLPIDAAGRKTITITWRPDEPPSGPYRYGFRVSDPASGAVLVDVVKPEAVLLDR